ncbi:unnamed protein product [Cyprideis torosa]|uniref:Uncharacterized protein n=1 Tax=Cyprideis torosa TaxID=163714 RepID=A0A7R8WBP6_9CRUS|nr:unnamed protein product [Cyprideis torosa]CAG0887599.1 unnamed protein product [Cyprideis torosa]
MPPSSAKFAVLFAKQRYVTCCLGNFRDRKRTKFGCSRRTSSLMLASRSVHNGVEVVKTKKVAAMANGVSSNGYSETEDENANDFIRDVVDLILKSEVLPGEAEKQKVVNFKHPKELEALRDLSLNQKNGLPHEELLSLCKFVIHHSIKTASPYFRNQLYGGADPYGIAGAVLTEALNTNQHTYEVAPPYILIERALMAKVAGVIGWNNFDGITAPGGSTANMYGIVAARYKKFPQTKTQGLFGLPKLTIFTSEDSHYSVLKAAHWLGFGTENVIKVKTDLWGTMIPEELEKEIVKSQERGEKPLMVSATSGTTVLGAFDPLDKLADICQTHDMWLHVDGAWGGAAILSEKLRHLTRGIDRVDSFCWNPHKMVGAPLQTSILLVRDKTLLHHCNSAAATYLFQRDKFYDVSYDTGDKSVQCGRKVDAFKFWLMWKAHGDEGLQKSLEHTYEMAQLCYRLMDDHPGFRMVLPSAQYCNICFWYIPPSLRGQEETEDWWKKVSKVAPEIKKQMTLAGTLMIGYQPLKNKNLENFFRLILTCVPRIEPRHLEFMINEIDRIGKTL